MLLVDVGNTRIKYREAGGPMAAVAHDGDPAGAFARIVGNAESVAAVDVTGSIATVLRGREPGLMTSSASACGVSNAYPEPARLGADRWAALIGARASVSGACCIVDAGSAATADVLAADGRHLGGWIAPGIALAVDAVSRGTRQAAAGAAGRVTLAPALNTADAVRGGAVHALIGFALRVRAAAAEVLGGMPPLVVCGGDAAWIADAVPDATVIDDLVLRGLAVWAAGS